MFYNKEYGDGERNFSFVYKIQNNESFTKYFDKNYLINADCSTPVLKLVGVGKFDGNNAVDLVWKGWWGNYYIDRRDLNGTVIRSLISKPTNGDYYFLGIGDFNGDGISDIIWRSKAGLFQIYRFMDNGSYVVINVTYNCLSTSVPEFYQCAGIADFDGDKISDLFWIAEDGNTCFWKMSANGEVKNVPAYNIGPTGNWHVVAVGDLFASSGFANTFSDGIADIVWEGYDNGVKRKIVWQISPNFTINGTYLRGLDDFAVKGVGDYDSDGNAEMLLQSSSQIGYAKISVKMEVSNKVFTGSFKLISDVWYTELLKSAVLEGIVTQYPGGLDLELHSTRQFESRLRQSIPTNFCIYHTQPGANVIYNKSRLFDDLDLSGLVMGACPRGNFCAGGGVAIGKRWVMLATHVYNQSQYGANIYFVDRNDNIHFNKIVEFYKVGGDATDITLGYLSADLPSNIKIYSVLPGGSGKYIRPNLGRIPVFTRNQEGKLIVFDCAAQVNFFRRSLDIERAYFSRPLIVGDSGNPVFFIVDGEPVLTGLLWAGSTTCEDSGISSNVGNNIDLINSIMASKGGERLKVFSLDKFIKY